MISDAELAALKSCVDIISLAESFGAEPVREGRRYRCCCLWHPERTGSLVLYPDQGKYHCFGCPAHGDVVKMAQQRLDTDFLGAVRHLARFSGYWPEGLTDSDGQVQPKVVPAAKPPPRVSEDRRLKWHVLTPVPDRVPAPRLGTFEIYLHSAGRTVMPVAFWPYRDAVGRLLGCDVRYEYEKHPRLNIFRVGDLVVLPGQQERVEVAELLGVSLMKEKGKILEVPERLRLVDGREVAAADAMLRVKEPITWTWCERIEDGEQMWRMRAWDNPAPLYGLDRLAARPNDPVVICEGCKAADAGDRSTGMVGVSWRGGASTAIDFDHNDWSPLTGRHVVIWPDADEPGHLAAWHIAQHMRRVSAASVRVVDVSGLPKGWDLADA